MATQLQSRRGTTAQMNAFTGAEGEIAVNTSTDTLHVHDGSTAGGHALAKADGSNIATYAGSFTTLAASGASTLTGAVGINIAPTSYKLTVNSGATTETTAAAIGYNGDAGTNLYINTDHGNNLVSLYASGSASKEMRFLSGTLEVMRLGTTGNVGIGNISPSAPLDIKLAGTATADIFKFQRSDGAVAGVLNYNGTDGAISLGTTTAHPLAFDTNNTERMRIDSSGTIKSSVNGAVANLILENDADRPYMAFTESGAAQFFIGESSIVGGGGGYDIYAAANQGITFFTNALRRVDIDSSGSLLVGKTVADSIGTDGIELDGANDRLMITRNNSEPLVLNRRSSDGDIAIFRKDGAPVGSIGTISNLMTIGTGTTGLIFDSGQIYPWNMSTNAAIDASKDLGASGARFKDLYLSGNALITTAAGVSKYFNVKDGTYGGDVRFGIASGIDNDAIAGTFSNNNFKFYTASTQRMLLHTNGNLIWHNTPSSSAAGIIFQNTTHPSIGISGGADTNGRHRITFTNGNGLVGNISTAGSATAYNTTSDYRLKENVVAMSGATERLKQLNPSRFNFISDADTTVDGFLAHEVQAVVPEAITGTKDAMRDEEYEVTPAVLDDDGNVTTEAVMGTRSVPDYQGIDQSKLVPLLVATIQELEARLTALENN